MSLSSAMSAPHQSRMTSGESRVHLCFIFKLSPRCRAARQARVAVGSVAMTVTTTAGVRIVELIRNVSFRPLNKVPASNSCLRENRKRSFVAARFFHNRNWYRGNDNRTTPRRSTKKKMPQNTARGHDEPGRSNLPPPEGHEWRAPTTAASDG